MQASFSVSVFVWPFSFLGALVASPSRERRAIVSRRLTPLFCLFMVALLSGCQKSSTAQQHLTRAEDDAKRGNVNEAIIEYRRAIQGDPKLVLPHFKLGRIYFDRRDYTNAFEQLSETVRLEPANLEARILLARLKVRSQQFAESKKDAEAILKQHPDEIPALMVLGQSAQGLGDATVARSSFERVLRLQPTNSDALFLLGLLAWKEGQKDFAERNLKKAMENKPGWMMPVVTMTALLMQQSKMAEAEQVLRQSIARNPKGLEAYYLLTTLLMQQKRFPEAEGFAREIKSVGEADPHHRGTLGNYYFAIGKPALAEQEYLEISKKYPEDILNQRHLAALYLAEGKDADADRTIDSILSKRANDPQTLLLRGRRRIQQGRIEEGKVDLQRATQDQRTRGLAHYGLAEAFLREGQLKLAKQELQTASQLQPNLSAARLLLAQLELGSGNAAGARSILDQLLARHPATAVPYVMRSVALALQGDLSEAEKDLLPLLQEFPEAPNRALTYRTQAWIKFHQRQYAKSRKLLEQAYALQPASADALYLLGLTYLAEKQANAGLPQVEARVRAQPQWAAGYEILGKLQVLAGHTTEGEASLQKAIAMDPKLDTAQLALAGTYLAEGKLNEASDMLLKLTQSRPRWATPYFLLGQVSERQLDWPRAEGYYQKALEITPENAAAKNNLAWLYAEHGGNLDVALRLAQEAKEAQPENPAISDTLGWIYLKKGNVSTAIQLLRDSVEKGQQKALYQYHMGIAYSRAGRKTEARHALGMALKIQPNFPEAQDARRVLASLSN